MNHTNVAFKLSIAILAYNIFFRAKKNRWANRNSFWHYQKNSYRTTLIHPLVTIQIFMASYFQLLY